MQNNIEYLQYPVNTTYNNYNNFLNVKSILPKNVSF